MNTRYSPSTKSFYPLDIDYGDRLPGDLITVPQEDFDAAMARPLGHTFDFVAGALVISPHVPSSAEITAASNADIKVQIDALERGQARALREQALGMAGALSRLQALDASIAALRAQLVN